MNNATVLLVGLCTVDLVQRVAELPGPGEKLQSTAVEVVAGGPAANAAVAVAGLGGPARLVTVLGNHPLAALAMADLTAHQVRVVDAEPDRAAPPPVSAVLVRERDGERVVVSRNAAGMAIDGRPDWSELLSGAGALLVDGHHPGLAVPAARAARAAGVVVVLDAGSAKPVFAELLPLVDVCACSAAFRWGAGDTERAVHDMGVPVVVRTDGVAPVRWSVVGGPGKDGPVKAPANGLAYGAVAGAAGALISDPVGDSAHDPVGGAAGGAVRGFVTGAVRPPAVVARDTLGAGDVWHGALAHGIAALGRIPGPADLPGLVAEANRVAAIRVGVVGARAWADRIRI